MEYVGLDKKEFEKFIKDLAIVYSEISKEKAKIYYDFFCKNNITIQGLNRAKEKLYEKKTTNWFPTMAEIYELARDKTLNDIMVGD